MQPPTIVLLMKNKKPSCLVKEMLLRLFLLLSGAVVWFQHRPVEDSQTDQCQIQWRISITEV